VGSLDRYEWDSNAPLIGLLVSKADFSVKRVALPNGGVFHLGNAWEQGGLVRLSYARYGKFLQHLRGLALPAPHALADELAAWTQVDINPTQGTAVQTDRGLAGVEFPSFDTRHTGERTRLTVLMQNTHAATDPSWGMDSVLAVQGDKVQRYTYGSDWLAEEHIFVPTPGSVDDTQGWVLGTAFNGRRNKTTLSVFEANHLAKGPMAQLDLPYALPLGLHGQFVEARG
jgi:carotenoid cleavage dioxygenase-like enzyme